MASSSTRTNNTNGTPSTGNNGNSKLLNDYQLGDSLGKGAFGQVYRALNWATGETVAVKEIQLSNIPKAELGEIMSEIDLLKNLNHPNIVKYKGFVKTREYLYIILEFCENGSLHNICKRFGKFPETLVGVYTAQVLIGLAYLHEQGVIHRDIKGANILTDKAGCVKLADFGVASTAAASDDAVVGSPYWMAPEVIEQSGATTASDIWSVGCLVIELLEGKPPYHFLDPMPALFRIVQDDCPPIPEGASPIVKDFLYHCFQKDANLRISAKKLLRHPWMVSARRQLDSGGPNERSRVEEQKPAEARRNEQSRPLSNYGYDEAVLKVQEWNEALKSPSRPSKHPVRGRNNVPERPTTPTRASALPLLMPSVPLGLGPAISAATTVNQSGRLRDNAVSSLKFVLQPPEEQTDNWDDDFEEGISLTKLNGLEKLPFEEERASEGEDNAQTIRPNRSPSGSNTVPLVKAPSAGMSPIVEDYSDLAAEEDEDNLELKVADFKMKNSIRRGLFHPDDLKTLGLSPVPPGPKSAPLPELMRKPSRPALNPLSLGDNFSSVSSPGPSSSGPTSTKFTRGRSNSGTGSFGRPEAQQTQSSSKFGKYAENDDEDYDDVFGKPSGFLTEQGQTLQLHTRLSDKSWLGDGLSDEEDPFAEIDEGFSEDEDDLELNLQRDKHARLCGLVNQLIDELAPSTPDFQLREACDQLIGILTENPEMETQMVSSHGMLAILEVLEGRCSRDVVMKLLQIVNMLVTSDVGFLESFCLIGGIPVMMGFTSKKYPSECRLEASNFIRLLCHTSVLTLQMFISCRGLKVLVDLLDEDYTEQADLVVHALNGIGSVFELQSPTTKNDFCRMFIREGLLDPLSSALLNVMANRGESSVEMKKKIIQIILVFCQVSQSDIHVRNALGTRKVVRRLLRACELLEPECLVHLLKAVKHLSMNATLLEVLQNANAIEIVIKILDEQSTGPHSTEMANHIFQTCYNLCRLNKSRQEEAAQAGIVPSLKRVIETKSPLKQFALPILCDLASAGKSCRTLLWQHDGLSLYLRLLEDPYFQVSGLESILSWLQEETSRVEDELAKPKAQEALLNCFTSAKANSFENLLDPFLKICKLSTLLTINIAKSPQTFKRLVDRLTHSTKAVVRLNLLRILRTICEAHPNRAMLVERYRLHELVTKLSKDDAAVLVRELAREIGPSLIPALRPSSAGVGLAAKLAPRGGGGGPDTPKSSVAPRKMRRTASEANASHAPAVAQVGIGSGRPSGGMSSNSGTGVREERAQGLRSKSSRARLGEIPWQTPSDKR